MEKSRSLIGGLRKHLNGGNGGGVTTAEIDDMERVLGELAEVSAECDKLRAELAPRVKHMNEVLARAKEAYAEKKRVLKGYYPQEQWAAYGIPDKR